MRKMGQGLPNPTSSERSWLAMETNNAKCHYCLHESQQLTRMPFQRLRIFRPAYLQGTWKGVEYQRLNIQDVRKSHDNAGS